MHEARLSFEKCSPNGEPHIYKSKSNSLLLIFHYVLFTLIASARIIYCTVICKTIYLRYQFSAGRHAKEIIRARRGKEMNRRWRTISTLTPDDASVGKISTRVIAR